MAAPTIIAGYFVDWAIYARNYNVVDVARQSDKLTHILYAFANLQQDGKVILGDAWADTDKHFDASLTVDGKGDSWNDSGDNLYGNFKQFLLLKKQARHLKVSLSIGGWTWSTNFSAVAADPAKRHVFVSSAMEMLINFGLDGIDIDWEYPKDANDAENYVRLLYDMRYALDNLAQQQQTSRYLLSCALPAGASNYNLLKLKEMDRYLDIFYLMAYDFHGSWDQVSGHQANLYGGDVSVDKAVSDYIARGVPPHKIVMGCPMYGRAFSNTDGLGRPFSGIPQGSWEQGVYDYKVLPKDGAQVMHDPQSGATYSYHAGNRELVTYDTVDNILAKADYINQRQLGGAMFWELSGDAPSGPTSLLDAIHRGFHGAIDTTPNHLNWTGSKYANVKNGL
ncbi:hypothetical protein BZG36_04733 [Bifiguratus adelaidae]|uniref:chitinase n=1 Tax=Bifiguratus adelaidae TaxID=1938954 RepID=A0A261XUS1_9FUNG|nr:hypothetical protein BZG36_04733 [Bifiguratus adelaidae]